MSDEQPKKKEITLSGTISDNPHDQFLVQYEQGPDYAENPEGQSSRPSLRSNNPNDPTGLQPDQPAE